MVRSTACRDFIHLQLMLSALNVTHFHQRPSVEHGLSTEMATARQTL